jgi:predicted PolB exonuclease-like 3'-5' exonuclease
VKALYTDMNLTLDIETLPTNNQELIAEFRASITAPGQYKKADSIKEWLDANLETETASKVAKTSFDGLYGSIACICYAIDDESHVSFVSSHEDGEKKMLENFFNHLIDLSYRKPLTVIGHNVAGFDLPFLKHRCILNGVKPIKSIVDAMNAKPWDSCIADTMLMWSNDREKRVSLDKLSKALGIGGKGDFNGSMVAHAWDNGEYEKVIKYCQNDVTLTRNVYHKLIWS